MTLNALTALLPAVVAMIKLPLFVRNVGPFVVILLIFAFLYFVVRGRNKE